MIETCLKAEPFNPWPLLEDFDHRTDPEVRQYSGASSIFVGTMRNHNQGLAIERMRIEHYPGMTERTLRTMGEQALTRHQLQRCLIVHRIGEITRAQTIVLIATWSAHRGPAIAACSELIEQLKTHIPLWKQEQSEQGLKWLIPNDGAKP